MEKLNKNDKLLIKAALEGVWVVERIDTRPSGTRLPLAWYIRHYEDSLLVSFQDEEVVQYSEVEDAEGIYYLSRWHIKDLGKTWFLSVDDIKKFIAKTYTHVYIDGDDLVWK